MARHFRAGRWDAYGRPRPDHTSEMDCDVAPRTDDSLPRVPPRRSLQGVAIFVTLAVVSVAWFVGLVVCGASWLIEAARG